jgi:hypothetical protein
MMIKAPDEETRKKWQRHLQQEAARLRALDGMDKKSVRKELKAIKADVLRKWVRFAVG